MSAKAAVVTRADASAPTTAASHFMMSHPFPVSAWTIPRSLWREIERGALFQGYFALESGIKVEGEGSTVGTSGRHPQLARSPHAVNGPGGKGNGAILRGGFNESDCSIMDKRL